MVRQARSEATRKKIINAAVDLFAEVGYQATGLGDIIERAEMTKGALYYHFDSKEALATAIIEEGANTALTAFREHRRAVLARTGEHDPRRLRGRGPHQHRQDGSDRRPTPAGIRQVQPRDRSHPRPPVGGDGRRRPGRRSPRTICARTWTRMAVGEVIVGAMLGAELVSNVGQQRSRSHRAHSANLGAAAPRHR